MRPRQPYIVIHPAMPTNITGMFLVVHTDEWVAVSLGEQEKYDFTSEHLDYASADAERVRLNHQPADSTPPSSQKEPETQAPVKSGVSLQRSAT